MLPARSLSVQNRSPRLKTGVCGPPVFPLPPFLLDHPPGEGRARREDGADRRRLPAYAADATRAESTPLNGKTYGTFSQVYPFSALNTIVPLGLVNPGCFFMAGSFLYHCLNHLFLEFWCIPLVWQPFRHSKAPRLLVSIPYCLTSGVQLRPEGPRFTGLLEHDVQIDISVDAVYLAL